MSMSLDEAAEIMAKPEYVNRTRTDVYEKGDQFVAEWEGQTFTAGNMFGLDSILTYAGVPAPRNLFLIHPTETNGLSDE